MTNHHLLVDGWSTPILVQELLALYGRGGDAGGLLPVRPYRDYLVYLAGQDRAGAQIDESNAPADVSIQVYSQGNIVTEESGLLTTLRRTLAQSAGAIMWSLRMIGVAIAFLAPWALAIVGIVWIARRVIRARSKL